jgi:hypothetical protein
MLAVDLSENRAQAIVFDDNSNISEIIRVIQDSYEVGGAY